MFSELSTYWKLITGIITLTATATVIYLALQFHGNNRDHFEVVESGLMTVNGVITAVVSLSCLVYVFQNKASGKSIVYPLVAYVICLAVIAWIHFKLLSLYKAHELF